jgi:hypothetical protein
MFIQVFQEVMGLKNLAWDRYRGVNTTNTVKMSKTVNKEQGELLKAVP